MRFEPLRFDRLDLQLVDLLGGLGRELDVVRVHGDEDLLADLELLGDERVAALRVELQDPLDRHARPLGDLPDGHSLRDRGRRDSLGAGLGGESLLWGSDLFC